MSIQERFENGEFDGLAKWIAAQLGIDPERVEWEMFETASGAHPVVTEVLPTEAGQWLGGGFNVKCLGQLRTSKHGLVGKIVVPQDREVRGVLVTKHKLVGKGSWRGAQCGL